MTKNVFVSFVFAVKWQKLSVLVCHLFICHFSFPPSTEDQHSERGREALLLPPLHLRRRHGKHPPCLQRLSRHHPEDAPAAVRAVVMGEERCSATKKQKKKNHAKTDWTMKHPEPWVSELPLVHRGVWALVKAKTHTHTLTDTLTVNTPWSQNLMQTPCLQ